MGVAFLQRVEGLLELHKDVLVAVDLLAHLLLFALGLLKLKVERFDVALDFFYPLDDLLFENFLAMLHVRRTFKSSCGLLLGLNICEIVLEASCVAGAG